MADLRFCLRRDATKVSDCMFYCVQVQNERQLFDLDFHFGLLTKYKCLSPKKRWKKVRRAIRWTIFLSKSMLYMAIETLTKYDALSIDSSEAVPTNRSSKAQKITYFRKKCRNKTLDKLLKGGYAHKHMFK